MKTSEESPSAFMAEVPIYIPSFSRWFSWNSIHECEKQFLTEFFDSKSHSKNPSIYKYYRNSIIKNFRQNPSRKITFTNTRKIIIGDVGSVRRVFNFVETWGLINYMPTSPNMSLEWDKKETRLVTAALMLGNSGAALGGKYVGPNSSDYGRVEINDEMNPDWTDEETLQLLEAAMHFGDDWKKVSEYVRGRSERDYIAHFIKLPFEQQFVSQNSAEGNKFYQSKDQNDHETDLPTSDAAFPNKKGGLSPLADASNPIIAQAACLSALGGVDLSELAAQAALNSLSESSRTTKEASLVSLPGYARQQGVDTDVKTTEKMQVDARSEMDLERAICYVTNVQLKEIQEKILKFEESELLMEREWEQLEKVKHELFVDQLTHLFHKNSAPKAGETLQPNLDTA